MSQRIARLLSGLLTLLVLLPPWIGSAAEGDWWTTHTNGDRVMDLAQDGGTLYAATGGGLVIWDLAGGTSQKVMGTDLWDNSLYQVTLDASGRIWVATEDEGFAYGGPGDWNHLTEAEGLLAPEARCVLLGSDGTIWGGLHQPLKGFLVRWVEGELTVWPPEAGLWTGPVQDLAEAPDGRLWLACNQGASVFDGTSFESFTAAEGLPSGEVRAVHCEPDGTVWLATQNGVARWDGETWTILGAAQGLPSEDCYEVITHQGAVWVGTQEGPAWWDGSAWHALGEADGLPRERVRALLPEPGGGLWIGTHGDGIYLWRDGAVARHLLRGDGLPDNFCRSAMLDEDGILWVGTKRGGAGRFDGLTWEAHTEQELDGRSLRCLKVEEGGSVWASTFGNGFYRYDGSSWTRFNTASGLRDDYGMTTAVGPDGRVWFGTAFQGVSVWDGQTFTHYDMEDGLSHWRVYWIDFEGEDKVWFTCDDGVSVFDGVTWQSYNDDDGLAFPRTYAVDIDSTGAKWFGSCRGVSRFDGETWTVWAMENSDLPWFRCNAVVVDQDDTIWVGTGRGLAHFDYQADTWTVYTPRDGLAGWDVSSVFLDRRGNVWTACRGGGVSCLHRSGPEPGPRVLAAGAVTLAGPAGPELLLQAVPHVFDGNDFLRGLELTWDGLPTGVFLTDDGTGGDPVAGDGIFTLGGPLGPAAPGAYPFGLVGTDYYGVQGLGWPHLTVR